MNTVHVAGDQRLERGTERRSSGLGSDEGTESGADSLLDAVALAVERHRGQRSEREDLAGLRKRFDSLSKREQQVMTLVTIGRLNKQVADDLDLSEITVKIHRGSAMRKMGATSLADLVRMAEALKLPKTLAAALPQSQSRNS